VRSRNRKNRVRENRSHGSVGEPVGDHRLYPDPIFPISPMTGHATRFHPPNRATELKPAGCGEESPRSCTRWKKQRRRERGRPRPHQRDDRSCSRFDHTNPQPNIHENLKKLRISTGFQPLVSLIWPTYLGRCPRLV